MLDSFARWLEQTGSQVFWTCSLLLVVIDVAAAAVVFQTRSRELVNRWTGRVLAINALLLGTGLGVPAAMYATRVVVSAMASPLRGSTPQSPDAARAARREK
jgi:hypothetical protein